MPLQPKPTSPAPPHPAKAVLAGGVLTEDRLREISNNMDPEEGPLWVHGVGEHGVPAFTEYGIECLKQIISSERVNPRSPGPARSK